MRIAITLLLVVHGLLHLLGFLKAWGLAALPQLSGRTLLPLAPSLVRWVGLAWLLAALVLLAAAALRGFRHESWWIVALSGATLSQLLIILQWPDAKAGSVANLLIVLCVIFSAVAARWERRVDTQIRILLSRAQPDAAAPAVSASSLAREQHPET
jgi:hypothetical protein